MKLRDIGLSELHWISKR